MQKCVFPGCITHLLVKNKRKNVKKRGGGNVRVSCTDIAGNYEHVLQAAARGNARGFTLHDMAQVNLLSLGIMTRVHTPRSNT